MDIGTIKKRLFVSRFFKLRLLWGVLGCLVIVLGVWIFWGHGNKVSEDQYRLLEPIQLGGEKEGVRLELVDSGNMAPAPQNIRVHTNKGVFMLTSLKQLEGLLTVNNPETALRLVRIPSRYVYAMPLPFEIEIQQHDSPPQWQTHEPKALSTKEIQVGGFSPATVKEKDGAYVVTRWVVIDSVYTKPVKVQFIRETVGKEGSYRREVLKEKSPPNLPGVSWTVPLRM